LKAAPGVHPAEALMKPLPAALAADEFYETRPLYECSRLQYQRVRNGGRSPEFVE